MPPARTVGPFEILDRLGAGGMGEVFKARDTRLNRFVALKFLPELATTAARERFQREAMAVAALNHPHICTLHEIGEDQGRPYLVLELLEGETLKARLRRGLLDADQLLDWSVQIAEALDAAHRKGILHRDLKPDNIWVAPGGHLKVLDFGLARLETETSAEAETILTSPGQTMGTVPYMSPEQARGEALDARSDLFSFGSVFYEMAAGKAAFPATNAADSIAAVLRSEPQKLSAARPELPPRISEVAERCLEKDPDLRYQSAADLRGELKRLRRESGSLSSSTRAAVPPPAAPSQRRWLWPALSAVVVLIAVAAWFALRPASTPPLTPHFRQITFNGNILDAVISPDGRFLAEVVATPLGTALHLLTIANGSDVEVRPPAPGCCQAPSFSPDGNNIYFLENASLKAIPLLGGPVRTIAPHACSGAGFSPDGTRIAYLDSKTPTNLLVVAQADGSDPRLLYQSPAGEGFQSQCWVQTVGQLTHPPVWSPDGGWIAANEGGTSGDAQIELVNVATAQVRKLGPAFDPRGGTDVTWLPGGHALIYSAPAKNSNTYQLWETTYPGGIRTQLTDDLQGYTGVSVSQAGAVAAIHSLPQASIWAQARPGGAFVELPGGGADQDGQDGLAWTPQDGLVTWRTNRQQQLWAESGDGGNAHMLPLDGLPAQAYNLNVAPNGQIVFSSGAQDGSIWRVNGDGSGLVELAQPPSDGSLGNSSPGIVRGEQTVLYQNIAAHGDQTLWGVPLAGGTPREIWPGFIFAGNLPISPDGSRILLTTRDANHGHAVVVLRLDASGGEQPQAAPTPIDPRSMHGRFGWTADGKAITFIVNQGTVDNLWAAPFGGAKPYPLTHFTDLRIGFYAMSHDGRLAISRGSRNQDAVVSPAPSSSH